MPEVFSEQDHVDPNLFRIKSIHKVYARALVELAEEQGVLEEVAGQVLDLADILRKEHRMRRLLTTPALGVDERGRILENIFRGRVHELIYDFLLMLNRKNRLGLAPGVIFAFKEVYDELHGALEIEAYVAQPIDDVVRQRITEAIAGVLGRQVVVHDHEDRSVIGGLKLKVGDQLIDRTVATRLKRLRRRIRETGRENTREHLDRILAE